MDLRDTKDVKALKVWMVFYIHYLLKENALVLPKNSLFVNYLQTKKRHANVRVLFQSSASILSSFR